MSRILLAGGLSLLCLLGTGCPLSTTPLSRIERNPNRYNGQEVTVTGRVEAERWIPQTGVVGFRLVDGNDSLLVLTSNGAPPAGSRVSLHGEIRRRFPVEGRDRVVLFYRIGPGQQEPPSRADTR